MPNIYEGKCQRIFRRSLELATWGVKDKSKSKKSIEEQIPILLEELNAGGFDKLPTETRAELEKTLELIACYFLPYPRKKAKTEQIPWVLQAISTDETRTSITDAWYDYNQGALIGTDGHRLHMACLDSPPMNKSGYLLNPDKDEKFPPYHQCFPGNWGSYPQINLSQNQYLSETKKTEEGSIITQYTWKGYDGEFSNHFNHKYIVEALAGMKDPIFHCEGPVKAGILNCEQTKRVAVIMPTRQ